MSYHFENSLFVHSVREQRLGLNDPPDEDCCLAHENGALWSRGHFITIRKPVSSIYAVVYGTLLLLSSRNSSKCFRLSCSPLI